MGVRRERESRSQDKQSPVSRYPAQTNTMLRIVLRRIQPSLATMSNTPLTISVPPAKMSHTPLTSSVPPAKVSHRSLTSSVPPDDPNPIAKLGLKELWPVRVVLVGLFGMVLYANPVRKSYPGGMDPNKWKE